VGSVEINNKKEHANCLGGARAVISFSIGQK
jgi:hypothetical protein